MTVAVVTDSTAGITADPATGVDVVPLTLLCGDETFVDGVEITDGALVERLRRGDRCTTSSPNPQAFERAYAAAIARGATSIVSLHLSSRLSRTYEAAMVAGRNCAVPVFVIDSRLAGLALGWGAQRAARLAASGASAQHIANDAGVGFASTQVWFGVDSVDSLGSGGRLNAAEALIASAMHIKPLLTLEDGAVVLAERVWTADRLDERLAQRAEEWAGKGDCRIAVQHVDAVDRAVGIAQTLARRGLEATVAPAGAVLGVHLGPAAIAVTLVPDRA